MYHSESDEAFIIFTELRKCVWWRNVSPVVFEDGTDPFTARSLTNTSMLFDNYWQRDTDLFVDVWRTNNACTFTDTN